MGFDSGNSGNVTPTQTSIRIPQARVEVVARTPAEEEMAKEGAFFLPINVLYDDFQDSEWLNFSPKVFLFRYKKKMTRGRNQRHSPDNADNGRISSAHFGHTENGIDVNNYIDKTTEFPANITLPLQGNGTNRPFYKKHATRIALRFTDWFRPNTGKQGYNPRGGATKNTRFSEYFKFCYCIEKAGKIYFGDLSTETIKMRVENIRNDLDLIVPKPILKLV